MAYPRWQYFPSNAEPPAWAYTLATRVASHASAISTVMQRTGLSSDDVLAALRPDLEDLGFEVETGKSKEDKIARAVLYGQNGIPELNYEIDGFHDREGIALEVEAGRGAQNGADYRDIIRASLILDAQYLVLMMPIAYRFMSGTKEMSTPAFDRSRDQLQAIYASQRLRLPFKGVLLLGY